MIKTVEIAMNASIKSFEFELVASRKLDRTKKSVDEVSLIKFTF